MLNQERKKLILQSVNTVFYVLYALMDITINVLNMHRIWSKHCFMIDSHPEMIQLINLIKE